MVPIIVNHVNKCTYPFISLDKIIHNSSLFIPKIQKGSETHLESLSELWAEVLNHIEKKVAKPSFDTWLKTTEAIEINKDQIIVHAPNEFTRDWLENSYTGMISETINVLTGSTLIDRKSTRLNSSHVAISYAVFCLKKKIKRIYL